MSIVAVHGPNMWGGVGAAGGGSGPSVTNAGGTVTADMTNGLRFTLAGAGDRNAADYDWTFSDGTAAINNLKNSTVTFATPGAKTITLTVGSTGGTTPPATTYTFNVTADTAPGAMIVENEAGTVTRDQYNGLLFALAGKGDRLAADYDWSFSDGTAAIPNLKTTSVTFTTAGQKTITLTVGTSGGTTPAGGTYAFPVTATSGVVPRSAPPPGGGGNGDEITQETSVVGSFDPSEHTVDEVKAYVTDHPDELEAIYDAEYNGKARSTLVSWLEEQFPFDPGDYTVAEVLEYAEANPDQLDEIIAAEQAGKNRSTLISQLEDLRV